MAYFQEAADELLTNSAIKLSILFNREYWKMKKKIKQSFNFSSDQSIFGVIQNGKLVFFPIRGKDYFFFKLRNLSRSNSSMDDIIDYCNIYFQRKLDNSILKGNNDEIAYYHSLLEYNGPQY